MKRSRVGQLVLGVALLGLSVGPAMGQRRYFQMRTRAPSTELGSVGVVGSYRTFTGPRAPTSPSSVARLPAGYAGVGLGAVGGGGLELPAAVARARTGVFSPSAATAYSTPTLGTADSSFLKGVTGFNRAMNFSNPLMATQWNPIPELLTPAYAPEAESNKTFDDYFGLVPREAEERVSAPVESMAEAMSEQTSRRLAALAAQGALLFKQATAPEANDRDLERDEKLARVISLCQATLDANENAYLPYILMVHAALERDQLMVASRALFGAVRRHPDVFVEQPELAKFFGDVDSAGSSARLDEEMRVNLHVGDENSEAAPAYALQAYCAWVLRDRARMSQALDRAEELARGKPDYWNVRMLRTAMEAAQP